jgi:anthranilate/para-aminobenzoate synthase component II
LDNAIISDQFKEIEKKIAKLIAVCMGHEATNLELKNKINSLEEELLGKIEAEKSYAQERALIRSKIDSLLVRLEEIIEV